MELTLGWLIATGIGGLILGGLIGTRFGGSKKAQDEIERLTAELAKSETAFDGYRREVFTEFSETAVKFKALNDTYTDLHQQLAKSAVALCGVPAAGDLLEAPVTRSIAGPALAALTAAAVTMDEGGVPTIQPEPVSDSADEAELIAAAESNESPESDAADPEAILVGEPTDEPADVPVLNEVVADAVDEPDQNSVDESQREHSADGEGVRRAS